MRGKCLFNTSTYSNQFKKERKKICLNHENDSNCLTQTNIVRFLKFKSL